jgi:hypothetical protein
LDLSFGDAPLHPWAEEQGNQSDNGEYDLVEVVNRQARKPS